MDGAEIYHYQTGYSNQSAAPDQILATNLSTGLTRTVVASCATSIGGPVRLGAVPPRATVSGLAYIESCSGGQHALRLISGVSNKLVSNSGNWFTTTPQRDRLIFTLSTSAGPNDSVVIVDLAHGTRDTFAMGGFGPSSPAAVSPDGNEMLVERLASSGRFAILSLVDGSVRVLEDSVAGVIPLGWNAQGLWFLGEPRPNMILYNPANGGVLRFWAGDALGSTRIFTGGTVTPTTGGAVAWIQNCNNIDPSTAACTQASYSMWLWNPLDLVDKLLVNFYTMPAPDFPRAFFAAASPDGKRLAYVLGDELRILQLQ